MMATLPPLLPLTHTTPSALNRTTKDTTTTAPRTLTLSATLILRTTAFTTIKMGNVITINMVTTLIVRYPLEPFAAQRRLVNSLADTDSENDAYGQRDEPSSESLSAPRIGISESSTPTVLDFGSGARDAYPAWSTERDVPLSKEEIEDIFLDLTQKFGFQKDSMRNMVGTTLHRRQADVAHLLCPY